MTTTFSNVPCVIIANEAWTFAIGTDTAKSDDLKSKGYTYYERLYLSDVLAGAAGRLTGKPDLR